MVVVDVKDTNSGVSHGDILVDGVKDYVVFNMKNTESSKVFLHELPTILATNGF
jgi:hypothetical protein